MKYYFLLLSFSLFLVGCKSESASTEETPKQETPTPPAQPTTTAEILYPSIPYEKLKFIYDNCDFVDYIYHTLPISMSLNEKSSIQNTLGQVSQSPALVNPNCNKTGTARMFFQSKGDQIAEAEMFFTDHCKYFVFYENGKPVYSNQMTPQGIDYLKNMFRQIQGQNQ